MNIIDDKNGFLFEDFIMLVELARKKYHLGHLKTNPEEIVSSIIEGLRMEQKDFSRDLDRKIAYEKTRNLRNKRLEKGVCVFCETPINFSLNKRYCTFHYIQKENKKELYQEKYKRKSAAIDEYIDRLLEGGEK